MTDQPEPTTQAGRRHARWLAFGNDLDGAEADEIVAAIEAEAAAAARAGIPLTVAGYEEHIDRLIDERTKAQDERDAALAQLSALAEALDEAHTKTLGERTRHEDGHTTDYWCDQCGTAWPCPTATILADPDTAAQEWERTKERGWHAGHGRQDAEPEDPAEDTSQIDDEIAMFRQPAEPVEERKRDPLRGSIGHD